MSSLITLIDDCLKPMRKLCEEVLSPLALLAARLLVAKTFFISGQLKLGYVLNDQLDTLYFLFEDYNVPYLPVEAAAWAGMSGELGLSVLLALGLFGRFAALGLIVMSGVIYSVDHNAFAIYWATLCLIIVAVGSGRLSLDALIFRTRHTPR